MKNILKIAASSILALILAVGNPMHTYAASRNLYISEIVTYTADSFEEAEAGLKDEGYTIVKDLNFNEYTDAENIYLGYKTTSDPDEAITDIAAMNMLGNFSYSEYEDILKDQEDAIAEGIEAVLPAIYAYQESLAAGEEKAEFAKLSLNMYYDDDSDSYMGDYFEAFDYDKDADELRDILVQCNSKIMIAMYRALAYTADYCDEESIFERMASLGIGNSFEDYKNENQGIRNPQAAYTREYEDSVCDIRDDWDDLYANLLTGKNALTTDADGNLVMKDEDDIENYTNAVIYAKLAEVDENGELEEYFMREYSSDMDTALYDLAYSMTDAQRSLLLYLSPLAIIQGDIVDFGGDAGSETLAEYEANLAEEETVSVYAGVNRAIFEDGIAFTSEATKHESLTGTSWYETSEGQETLEKVHDYCSYAALFGVIGTMVLGIAWGTKATSSMAFIRHYYTEGTAAYKAQIAACTKAIQTLKVFFGIMVILIVVSSVLAIVCDILSSKGKNPDKKEELIPAHIVTAKQGEYGTEYVYYSTVQNQDDEPGDLNNHEGSVDTGWLVLYYTKDDIGGDPILASSLSCIKDGNTQGIEGKSGIHMFNESSMANLTSSNYKSMDVDDNNGLYVCYNTDPAAGSAVGSAFDYSDSLLLGICGIACGIISGFFLGKYSKKKKEAAAA